jgi:hypothetical protein
MSEGAAKVDISQWDLFAEPLEGPDDPRPIVARLIDEYQPFEHLKVGEANFFVLFRQFELVKSKRLILGQMALPVAQGSMRDLFAWLLGKACESVFPDFILTIERDWWTSATDLQRNALVFHELCHCGHDTDKEGMLKFTDEGRPVYTIVGHDIEEFDAVVARYGAWNAGITAFRDAMREGGIN